MTSVCLYVVIKSASHCNNVINKVHYLISLDVNLNDKVIELINALQRVEGVEVESSLN